MSQGSHGGGERLTFSKFKYRLQNFIAEARQIRENERNTRKEMDLLNQKQRNEDAEHQRKCAAFRTDFAAANEVRLDLETKVKDLENEITILTNKHTESKALIDQLLQSRDKLTSDLKASNYELRCAIQAKDSEIGILNEKLRGNIGFFKAVEKEAISVKIAVDETRQLLNGKEDEVVKLKLSLDKMIGYETLFVGKIQMLETKMKENKIEHSKKDKVIADLKEHLDSLINDHKLEMEVEALQRTVNFKDEMIQNLLLGKEELLSEIQSLELLLAKFQDTYMKETCRELFESQEVAYTPHKKARKAQEIPYKELKMKCMRHEDQNDHLVSAKSELVALGLKEKNANVDGISTTNATLDLATKTNLPLLEERKPCMLKRRGEASLREHHQDFSSRKGDDSNTEKVHMKVVAHVVEHQD